MKRDDFEHYLDHPAAGIGHADRVTGLKDYYTGLMLPVQRKSVEPLTAHLDPLHGHRWRSSGAESRQYRALP